MRPRIGVSSLVADAAGWPDWCRRLEAAGIDEISVADHLKAGVLPPLVALAAAATVTDRVALSTMVLNNELRHPGVLANEVALLSELSAGRFTLGIGAGHAVDEHDAIGVPLAPAAERIARLEESVAALRRLLDGEAVTTDGPRVRLTDFAAAPVPAHRVPILVGGGARGVLRVAARHADVVGLTGFSATDTGATTLTHLTNEGLEERLAWIRSLAPGRSVPLRFQALVQLVVITDDRRAAAERAMEAWGAMAPPVAEALRSPFLLFGTVGEIADQLHERSQRLGIETWTMFAGRPIDAPLEDLAAIAAALRS